MNKVLELTQEQIDALVQAKVAEALSSRDEEEARRQSEAALAEAKETFEQLRASIEEKSAKIAEYEAIFADLDTDPTAAEVAANEKIVELETAVEDWKRRAEVAEAALTTLALEEAAASRMAELEESGVALDDDAAETQYAKIRNMSDDEFAEYKDELVALRSKYASVSEEADQSYVELSELSSEEVRMIAQSLGCDPSDSKCISLVQEVAQKMAEVSKNRRSTPATKAEDAAEEEGADEEPNKETASQKTLSYGEALSRAMDQKVQVPATMRDELTQEWVKYYEGKKQGEK